MKSAKNFYFIIEIILDVLLITFCAFLSVILLANRLSSFSVYSWLFLTSYRLCIFIPLNIISGAYRSFNLVEAPRFSLRSLGFFALGISLLLAVDFFGRQSLVSSRAFLLLPLFYICGLTLLRTMGNRCFELFGCGLIA